MTDPTKKRHVTASFTQKINNNKSKSRQKVRVKDANGDVIYMDVKSKGDNLQGTRARGTTHFYNKKTGKQRIFQGNLRQGMREIDLKKIGNDFFKMHKRKK